MEVLPTAESTPLTKLVAEHLEMNYNLPRLFIEFESEESCDFKDPFHLDDFARLLTQESSDIIKNCRQPVSEYFNHDDQRPELMFEGDISYLGYDLNEDRYSCEFHWCSTW